MRIRTILALAFLAMGCGRSQNEALSTPITLDAPPHNEFRQLCQALDIPCAIEIDLTKVEDLKDRGQFKVTGIPGKAALDEAIKRYPGHLWELNKDVLVIRPLESSASSPLQKRLPPIKFNKKPLWYVWTAFAENIGFETRPMYAVGGPDTDKPVLISVSSSDGETSRQVLTSAIRSHGHAMWIVEKIVWDGKTHHWLSLQKYSPLSVQHSPLPK